LDGKIMESSKFVKAEIAMENVNPIQKRSLTCLGQHNANDKPAF
jgi:hypothetical protein